MKVLLLCSLVAGATASSMSIVPKDRPNLCLDLLGERTAAGTPIDIWNCTAGLLGQQWFFDAGTYKIRSAVNDKKCIDASGPTLSLNDCAEDSKAQGQYFGWDIATNAIYLTPDKSGITTKSMCFTAPEKSEPGLQLALAPCNASNHLQEFSGIVGPPTPVSKNETFTFSPEKDRTLCLDLEKNQLDNGSPVVVTKCSKGQASQEWIFSQGSYRISHKMNPLKCIDATSMAKGNHLILWDCNGFPQQQWGYELDKPPATTGTIYLTQPPAGTNPACLGMDSGNAVVGECIKWQLTQAKSEVVIV